MDNGYAGLFVTVEGIANSGKSTVMETADEALSEVVTTREPNTDMDTGAATRQQLETTGTNPVSDFHLFLGHRADHLTEVVQPALQQGKTVVCERYSDSTRAYQGEKLQHYVETPEAYIESALDESWHVTPDVTLLLDVTPETALERGGPEHKYEEVRLLEKVRKRYLDLASEHDRIIKVDAEQDPTAVRQFTLAVISEAQGQKAADDFL